MVEEVKATASTETETSTQRGAGSLNDLTGKIELIDDNIIFNEEFKKNVAIPYFKDIYKDLAAQSDAKSKGINKVSILNVSQRCVVEIYRAFLKVFIIKPDKIHCHGSWFFKALPTCRMA